MHDQVLAMISHCDALDFSAAMPGVGGGAEGGVKTNIPPAAAVTLVCTYSQVSYRISCLQKHLMYSKWTARLC